MERLLSNDGIQDLKLDVPDGCGDVRVITRNGETSDTNRDKRALIQTLTLITEGPLPGAPLEALNDAVFDRAQQRLVHLQGSNNEVV